MNNLIKKSVKFGAAFSVTAILGSLLMLCGCGGGGGGDSTPAGNVMTNNTGAVATTTNLPDGGDAKNSLVLSAGTLLKDASGNPVVGSLLATVSYSANAALLPPAVIAQVQVGNRVVSFLDITITKIADGQTVKSIAPPLAVTMHVPGVLVGSTVDIYTTNADGSGRQLLQAGLSVNANNQVSFNLNHLTIVTAETVTGSPASITADNSPRSAVVGTSFGKLQATVKDASGNPVNGALVTFTAPAFSGASGSFAGGVTTATTNALGVAESAVFTANTTTGSYTVTAVVAGVATSANFLLTNLLTGSTGSTGGSF